MINVNEKICYFSENILTAGFTSFILRLRFCFEFKAQCLSNYDKERHQQRMLKLNFTPHSCYLLLHMHANNK